MCCCLWSVLPPQAVLMPEVHVDVHGSSYCQKPCQCPWPMLPPEARWTPRSVLPPEAILIFILTKGCVDVHGLYWYRDHAEIWGLFWWQKPSGCQWSLLSLETIQKSMIHASPDCKGQGSSFFQCYWWLQIQFSATASNPIPQLQDK